MSDIAFVIYKHLSGFLCNVTAKMTGSKSGYLAAFLHTGRGRKNEEIVGAQGIPDRRIKHDFILGHSWRPPPHSARQPPGWAERDSRTAIGDYCLSARPSP
jgi:hypothetical protein